LLVMKKGATTIMADERKSARDRDLAEGRIALGFANTVDWHASDHPEESLHHYEDLVAWGVKAGTVSTDEASALRRRAAREPEAAVAILERARTFREVVYRVFSAVAGGRAPDPSDLTALNAALGEALPHLALAPEGDGFRWVWRETREVLERVLWPVATSAAVLLTSDVLDRVRLCADENCGWLFLDMSKNRSRRWCDMKSCGNRAKARRYYARQHADAS